jgi:hypothetical protein
VTEIEALVREKMVRVSIFPGHFHHPPCASPVTCRVGVFCFSSTCLSFPFLFFRQPVNRKRMAKHTVAKVACQY